MKILEAISFGAIALSLHITVISFFFLETPGSDQKEEYGKRETVMLSSTPSDISEIVKSWNISPELKSEIPTFLSSTQPQDVDQPFIKYKIDLDPKIEFSSGLKLMQNDQIFASPKIPGAYLTKIFSMASIDKLNFQKNDNVLQNFSKMIDDHPINETPSNNENKSVLEIFKPEIDKSSVTPNNQIHNLQKEPMIASQSKQPKKNSDQQKLSSQDAKITRENLHSWGSKIHRAIELKKFYPSGTRAQGRVVLNIVVHSSGNLVNTEIIKSSGVILLDNAAITAVKRAHFPMAPDGVTEDRYRFQIPIKMSRN
jgi:TonB family protein